MPVSYGTVGASLLAKNLNDDASILNGQRLQVFREQSSVDRLLLQVITIA